MFFISKASISKLSRLRIYAVEAVQNEISIVLEATFDIVWPNIEDGALLFLITFFSSFPNHIKTTSDYNKILDDEKYISVKTTIFIVVTVGNCTSRVDSAILLIKRNALV